jgi:hypothetical protein
MTWGGESSATESGIMVFSSDGSPFALTGGNDELIRWKDGKAEFVSGTLISGIPIDNLSDVDVGAKVLNDVLTWNGTNWIPIARANIDDGELNSTSVIASGINESTTSTSFVSVPGASGSVVLNSDATVFAIWMFDIDNNGGGQEVAEVRLLIGGETSPPLLRNLPATTDVGIGGTLCLKGPFASGTEVVVHPQFRSQGGSDVRILTSQLLIQAEEGVIGPSGLQGPAGADGADGADGVDGSGITVEDEGTSVGVFNSINFVGAGVTASSGTGKATVTIPGGGGGGGSNRSELVWTYNGRNQLAINVNGPRGVATSGTIDRIRLYRDIAGGSGSGVWDVNKNGTTIFTTQYLRPSILASAGDDAEYSGTPDVTTFVEGDKFTVDVDEVEGINPRSYNFSLIMEITYL